MKIVHINSLYAPFQIGGAEKSVQILAEAQRALGHDVSVLTTAPDGNDRQASINGVDIHYLSVRNLYRPFTDEPHTSVSKAVWHAIDSYNPMMGNRIGGKLDVIRPDIVHTHTIAGLSVSAWRAAETRRIPRVHTLRDYYLACPRSTMFKEGHNCTSPCNDCAFYAGPRRRQSARVDAVIGNSRFILDRHLALGYFPQARFRDVIYSGQPPRNVAASPRLAREKGQLPMFGYIGQLNPTKGVGLLVDAILDLGPSARLRIAGRIEGDYAARLRSEAPAWVEWLGWQKPADFYRSVDVVVVPSLWHEPLPRTVIEAASWGCRVIGSNRGGTPEALAMVGGTVFDPDLRGALASALRHELSFTTDAAPCATENAPSINAAFDPEARARDYLEAYRVLVA